VSEVLARLSPGFPARELKIVCPCDSRQIHSQEPSGARLGVSTPYVARELPETLVRCRLSLSACASTVLLRRAPRKHRRSTSPREQLIRRARDSRRTKSCSSTRGDTRGIWVSSSRRWACLPHPPFPAQSRFRFCHLTKRLPERAFSRLLFSQTRDPLSHDYPYFLIRVEIRCFRFPPPPPNERSDCRGLCARSASAPIGSARSRRPGTSLPLGSTTTTPNDLAARSAGKPPKSCVWFTHPQ
jgi:hypothetical protein